MTEYEKHELDSRLERDRRSGRMQGLSISSGKNSGR